MIIGHAILDFNGSRRCLERLSAWSLPKSDRKDKSQSPWRIERGFIRTATKRIEKLLDCLFVPPFGRIFLGLLLPASQFKKNCRREPELFQTPFIRIGNFSTQKQDVLFADNCDALDRINR